MENNDKFAEQSPDTDSTVYAAFARAQSQFKALQKNSSNNAFKNAKYADIHACLDAVVAALNANGFGLTQSVVMKEMGLQVDTVCLHESGGILVLGNMVIPITNHTPHGFASAVTYARRYSLMLAFGLGADDDDGNAASDVVVPVKLRHSPLGDPWAHVPPDQHEYLRELAKEIEEICTQQGGAAAKERHAKENLDNEQETAVWSLLTSSTRSAIKKAKQH
jgi:hypothetical protein